MRKQINLKNNETNLPERLLKKDSLEIQGSRQLVSRKRNITPHVLGYI
jgi:hypothetical protein